MNLAFGLLAGGLDGNLLGERGRADLPPMDSAPLPTVRKLVPSCKCGKTISANKTHCLACADELKGIRK